MNTRIRAAKTAFWAAGKLAHIKTPQRVRRVVSWEPLVTVPAGRSWGPCRPSFRLLRLSMHLDWEHWDHWACLHEDCNPLPCPVCGGGVCQWGDEDE